MRKSLTCIFILISFHTYCQDTMSEQDTSVLSLPTVLNMTLSYHPVVKQAELLTFDAEAEIRQAKGNLDPKIEMGYNLKDFKQTEYYDLLTTTLKVPTQIGFDPKIEYSRNEGAFVNDQNEIPESNGFEQVSLGFSIAVGKGLFYDERRNAIQRAQAFSQIADAQQRKEINKILLTVIKDYWSWYVSYQRLLLLQQAIVLSENLFDRTMIDYEFGEASVVDTLQAIINLQKRTVDYRKAQAEYEISKLNLEKHLWSEDLVALEIQPNVIPDSSTLFMGRNESQLKADISFALENHPEIDKIEGKQNQLNADERWAKESLKPQIDLSYSFIDAPLNSELESNAIVLNENYKMGIDFSYPLFLRKERGKLQQTRLKIQSNEYDLAQNQVNIKNDVLVNYTQAVAFRDLLTQYQNVSVNYRRLLDAEIINLQNGETDLFKLNIQQDKYIEAQNDYYEAFMKWEKSKAEYFYSTGLPLLGLTSENGLNP